MQRKKKIVLISVLLAYAIVVPVFAYLYFYTSEPKYMATGIILRNYQTPTMKLGFYWDPECTQNVTTFDFGNMTHPNQDLVLWKTIYIRNEGDVWHNICYNSTLLFHYPTTTELANDWTYIVPNWGAGPDINNTRIEPGAVVLTYYKIFVPHYYSAGTYNWTLTAWGEHWY